jgi:serine/threonine-protein kinase
MPQPPPQHLIEFLQRLKLATPEELRAVDRRVRRLARGLPPLESVWVDALAQARLLTHFQASQINAGRGEALFVGPYVLYQRPSSPAYVDCYLAREIDSLEMTRLAVIPAEPERAIECLGRLEALVAKAPWLDKDLLAPVIRAGRDGDRVWAASRHVAGRTAAEWMIRRGRFPPPVVLEIARQMVAGLERLEALGLCHGDINAHGLILLEGGRPLLPQPGLRPIVHPKEGSGPAQLPPEAYDGVAPERIMEGTPASIASDIYACASLWWHLLAGRAPVPGGTGPLKLDAVATARIPDVRDLAPDTPGPLAKAIAAGLEPKPGARPDSMAQMAGILGPLTRAGRRVLNRHLSRPSRNCALRPPPVPRARAPKTAPAWLVAIGACLLATVAVSWSAWHPGTSIPPASIPRPPGEPLQEPSDRDVEPIVPGPAPDFASDPESELLPDARVNELVLSSRDPLHLESLELRPGVWVRGEPGCRPLVLVPPGGLTIEPDGVRFENIDFLWDPPTGPVPSPQTEEAVVHVLAAQAVFRGCTFRAAEGATRQPVAIRWTYPPRSTQAELSLFSGQLQLSDSVLDRVRAAVSCQTAGTPAVEMANVLHLGTGPLVQLDHCPGADEPVLVRLSNVTLRGAGPLLECRYRRIPDQPGGISVRADGCVLLTRPQTPLLSFVGPDRPERLLNRMRWDGQGSLVLPDALIAAWQPPGGEFQMLDDSVASIAGLVRSNVQFAGAVEAGPQACRIVRWQAPLRSPNAPGIDAHVPDWQERQADVPRSSHAGRSLDIGAFDNSPQ